MFLSHIKAMRFFFLALLTILFLSSCDHADEKFKSYTIGFTTQGQEVSVDDARIDNLWSIPGSVSTSGVWEQASGGASFFNQAIPHEISVNWLDKSSNKRYEATVKLVDDLAKRARVLPPVWLTIPQQEIKEIDIIIGLAPNGKVIAWLSNAPHGNNLSGRVLEVIGEAQGNVINQPRPTLQQ